jgi:hypothetical protein
MPRKTGQRTGGFFFWRGPGGGRGGGSRRRRCVRERLWGEGASLGGARALSLSQGFSLTVQPDGDAEQARPQRDRPLLPVEHGGVLREDGCRGAVEERESREGLPSRANGSAVLRVARVCPVVWGRWSGEGAPVVDCVCVCVCVCVRERVKQRDDQGVSARRAPWRKSGTPARRRLRRLGRRSVDSKRLPRTLLPQNFSPFIPSSGRSVSTRSHIASLSCSTQSAHAARPFAGSPRQQAWPVPPPTSTLFSLARARSADARPPRQQGQDAPTQRVSPCHSAFRSGSLGGARPRRRRGDSGQKGWPPSLLSPPNPPS